MPLRLKGSHHVNLPLGIDKIFSLISGFLNEKGKERVINCLTFYFYRFNLVDYKNICEEFTDTT